MATAKKTIEFSCTGKGSQTFPTAKTLSLSFSGMIQIVDFGTTRRIDFLPRNKTVPVYYFTSSSLSTLAALLPVGTYMNTTIINDNGSSQGIILFAKNTLDFSDNSASVTDTTFMVYNTGEVNMKHYIIDDTYANVKAAFVETDTATSFLAGDGSVSLPGYSFSSETNSGWYRIAANRFGFAVNGVKVYELNSDGTAWTFNGAVAAAGTDQPSATVLAAQVNNVSTVLSGQGVSLQVPIVGGLPVIVQNTGANALVVYPNSGGTIDGGSANAGVTLAPGHSRIFVAYSTTAWNSLSFKDTSPVGTGTEASNAVTIQGTRGVITSSALSNGAGVNYVITLTNALLSATSIVKAWITNYSGTPTTNGLPILFTATPGTGTVVMNIANAHSVNALSGTVKIYFEIQN